MHLGLAATISASSAVGSARNCADSSIVLEMSVGWSGKPEEGCVRVRERRGISCQLVTTLIRSHFVSYKIKVDASEPGSAKQKKLLHLGVNYL